MASVYDDDAYSQRVNYAAQCFIRGTESTRHFDTCFEMDDGAAVVTALVRRADKNPSLLAAIARQWHGGFPQSWRDTAATYADIPTRQLVHLARRLCVEAGLRRHRPVQPAPAAPARASALESPPTQLAFDL